MSQVIIPAGVGGRRLTSAEFQQLAAVPAAAKWFANIDNPRTRRAYQGDLEDFCSFVGLTAADELRAVTRSHVLAQRAQLEQRGLTGATIRRKLATLAGLFDHLLESNAVAGGNPGHGIKRPKIDTNEGKPPALGDHQVRALLKALPLHPVATERIHAQLEASGHHQEAPKASLFRPLRGRLIYNSDFSDHVAIIERKDNWESMFKNSS